MAWTEMKENERKRNWNEENWIEIKGHIRKWKEKNIKWKELKGNGMEGNDNIEGSLHINPSRVGYFERGAGQSTRSTSLRGIADTTHFSSDSAGVGLGGTLNDIGLPLLHSKGTMYPGVFTGLKLLPRKGMNEEDGVALIRRLVTHSLGGFEVEYHRQMIITTADVEVLEFPQGAVSSGEVTLPVADKKMKRRDFALWRQIDTSVLDDEDMQSFEKCMSAEHASTRLPKPPATSITAEFFGLINAAGRLGDGRLALQLLLKLPPCAGMKVFFPSTKSTAVFDIDPWLPAMSVGYQVAWTLHGARLTERRGVFWHCHCKKLLFRWSERTIFVF